MPRRLLSLAASLSLLVFMAVIVLWYRAHFDLHQLRITHVSQTSEGSSISLDTHTYQLSATRGSILLYSQSDADSVDRDYFNRFLNTPRAYAPGWRYSFRLLIPKDLEESVDYPPDSRCASFGFQFGRRHVLLHPDSRQWRDQWHLTFPISYLASTTSLAPAAWFLLLLKRSRPTRRRLFFSASALSLACCASVVFLWIRGYWVGDQFVWTVNDAVEFRMRGEESRGYFSGEVYESVSSVIPAHTFRLERKTFPAETVYSQTYPINSEQIYWNRWGTFATRGFEYGEGFVVHLQFPLRPPALGSGLLPAAFIVTRLRKRPRKGHCQVCGYDLTGNISGTCPECGTSFSHAQPTSTSLPGCRLPVRES